MYGWRRKLKIVNSVVAFSPNNLIAPVYKTPKQIIYAHFNQVLSSGCVHSSLVSLSSIVFCSSGVRLGKKLTPVTLSMSLMGVSANLSNLDVGDGSCIQTDKQVTWLCTTPLYWYGTYPRFGWMLEEESHSIKLVWLTVGWFGSIVIHTPCHHGIKVGGDGHTSFTTHPPGVVGVIIPFPISVGIQDRA